MPLDLSAIHNVGEFYSNHYLDALLEGDLKSTYERWALRERDQGVRTPMKSLLSLSSDWFKARARVDDERDPQRRWEVARDFHLRLLEALGYRPACPGQEPLEDSLVPVVHTESRDGNPFLWVVDAPFPPDEDSDPLDQVPRTTAQGVDGARLTTKTWRELLDEELFRLEHPPRWVLFLSGTEAWLIDRYKWGQGRYLRFLLGDLFARRQESALRATAGLLHRDVLNPQDGTCLHDTLDEKSHKHAFAVSTDLKFGARQAIELLANEAVRYRREKQKTGVFNEDDLARQLTADCLNWLYRILFLFYVEARGGELGIVPMASDEYRAGYSLEALRDLELVPLTTTEAQDGYYIHNSLQRLFQIVFWGFGLAGTGRGGRDSEAGQIHMSDETAHDTFQLHGLRSPLFDDDRLQILKGVKFRNVVLQQVLQQLSLSKEEGRRQRGRISYATLGINQLGAVYEGLLSYTGFFAREDLYEVRGEQAEGDGEARTYFVPATSLPQYKEEEVAKDGDGRRIVHPKGTFMFRLAGRDREKSASYYTPEVLTRCLTKYSLKERLEGEPADKILQLTICEPAMGSGAFLNEAINQLAEAYLERKQNELGQTIPSEAYQAEKQRVKYYLAVHQVYGVDKNPLATELAKVSIGLNILLPEAASPYFGVRLAVGNSLIGGRREVFQSTDLLGTVSGKGRGRGAQRGGPWLDKVPDKVALGTPRPAGTVYHFLLPNRGMAPFDQEGVVKELEPENAAHIKQWRAEITQAFAQDEVRTLERLSDRIDDLWKRHLENRQVRLASIRQPVEVWGQPKPTGMWWKHVEECEEYARQLTQGTSPGRRLAAVMDYWCALWFWPVQQAGLLPTRDEWLMEVEGLLDGDVDLVMERVPRLRVVRAMAERYRFHHWEVSFPEVFAEQGGFDVILGNPPWVQLHWDERLVLADFS
ncbi:MAG TPA: hypothetical protein VGO93_18340, partial [Candidatus Xenobia bacterium]